MIEVEIKIPILDVKSLEEDLLSIDFKKGTTVFEDDIYFNATDRDFRLTDEALRIRKHVDCDTQETVYILNYKGCKIDQITMARDEFQTKVASQETMCAILNGLGYHPYSGVTKTRIHYKRGKMTACIDAVENLGDYLELEILAENETEYEHAVKEIASTLEELHLSMEQTIRKSYLNMIEEKSGL